MKTRRTAWQKRTGLKGIGPLKQGLLKKVGYSVTASKTRRHAAVKRAVKKYGKASTIRKLNAVAVYTRKSSPAKSRAFRADMKFVQKMKGGDPEIPLPELLEKLNALLADIDRKQLEISANKYYNDKLPDLVRAGWTYKKLANELGIEADRDINLGDLKNAVGAKYDAAYAQQTGQTPASNAVSDF